MRYYPLFRDTRGQRIVIVGGGDAAANKARLSIKSEAEIIVVDPAPNAELLDLAERGAVRLIKRRFRGGDLKAAVFAFAASEDAATRDRTVRAARRRGVLINTVDVKDACDFITPALVDRDPVTIAISSDGDAPVLARWLKGHAERCVPAGIGGIARLAEKLRPVVKQKLADFGARRAFWERLVQGDIGRALMADGDAAAAERGAYALLADQTGAAPPVGRVTLVGAGPGDPDLLTIKAMRALQTADTLVIDRLVGEQVLEVARRDAKRIFVGKTPGQASPKQPDINAILVAEALAGHHVVRVKGGDPLVYGRAVEEIEALDRAGVPVTVVPGVTSALGCAAAHRMPLTRRDEFRSLVFLTATGKDGFVEHDWPELAKPGQTLAIYMGVRAAEKLEARLLAHGGDPETPITVIENGTRPDERVLVGRLRGLAAMMGEANVIGPALIYVGVAPLPVAAVKPEAHALQEAA